MSPIQHYDPTPHSVVVNRKFKLPLSVTTTDKSRISVTWTNPITVSFQVLVFTGVAEGDSFTFRTSTLRNTVYWPTLWNFSRPRVYCVDWFGGKDVVILIQWLNFEHGVITLSKSNNCDSITTFTTDKILTRKDKGPIIEEEKKKKPHSLNYSITYVSRVLGSSMCRKWLTIGQSNIVSTGKGVYGNGV